MTDGRGYAAATGPGAGAYSSTTAGGGGGHGGSGGNGGGGSPGGFFYGSPLLPNDFGSGGGNSTNMQGGAGGGRILITATDTVNVAGTLSSGGSTAASVPNGGNGGGGAGGTIRITAENFWGSGRLLANGGDGGADTDPYNLNNGNSGGGGGGRIAVYTDSETFTTTGDVQVEGGNGGTGFGPAGQDGQVGTVRFLNIRPVITLTGEMSPLLEAIPTENYVEAGATAMDSEDGDISGDIEVSGDGVDRGQPGTYEIHYNVVDSEGNAATQVTRIVTVQDTLPPVLALHLNGEVYLRVLR